MTTNYPPPAGSTTGSNTTNPPGYADLADELLIGAYAAASRELSWAQAALGRIEQAILQRMEERGATAIPDETYRCELHVSHTYEQASFAPFLEILTAADLETVFVPAHIEPVRVKDKWDTQKLIALARRYGDEAKAIIERAKQESGRRLKFEKRKEAL